MGFIVLLIFAVLSLAGSAAFFSIYGLAQIFAGSFWPVVVMAVVLEIGKLVAASFVYRYWKKLAVSMRAYLISAVLVLMFITSMGIFGFLSGAYQRDILPLQQKEQKLVLLEQEKQEVERLRVERLERRREIDKDIAGLPNDYVTGRQRLMESYGPELNQIRDDIKGYTKRVQEITLEVQELKTQKLEQEVHIGPIVFIAEAFNKTTNEATKWLIILIIFAFDPLAVMMTVGANLVIIDRQKRLGTYIEEEPRVIHREIIEHEVDNRDAQVSAADITKLFESALEKLEKKVVDEKAQADTADITTLFESALEKLEKKMEPTKEDEALKAAIGQILRRNQIARSLRTGRA